MFGLSGNDAARLGRVERKLDLILAHLGLDLEAASRPSAEVLRLAVEGRTIDAIRQHRRETGAGLAEAKAVVDEHCPRV